jgi:CheY-like chemotaxis protein
MKKENILLVYDSPKLLAAMGWVLEVEGYPVTTVSSIEEILNMLTGKRFGLLILDMHLNESKDIDTLKQVKSSQPGLMMILLCREEDMTHSKEILGIGADEYVIKPCSKTKLWKIISNCLEKRILSKREMTGKWRGEWNGHFLETTRIQVEDMKLSILLMEEIIKLINKGLYGKIDNRVTSKLDDLHQIASRLYLGVEALSGKIKEASKGFGIDYQIPKWQEDVVDPALGNLPRGES